MPPRKDKTESIEAENQKVGDVAGDANGAVANIPARSMTSSADEIDALRKQVDALRQQISDAAAGVKAGAKQAVRQTEATVKLYPVSSVLAVAAVTAAFALAVAGPRSAPPRSRYDRTRDDIRDFHERVRQRI